MMQRSHPVILGFMPRIQSYETRTLKHAQFSLHAAATATLGTGHKAQDDVKGRFDV